jgi:hypothetical protein
LLSDGDSPPQATTAIVAISASTSPARLRV